MRRTLIVLIGVAALLAPSGVGTSLARAPSDGDDRSILASLPSARVSYHRLTGHVRFLAGPFGRPLMTAAQLRSTAAGARLPTRAASPAAATATAAAGAFLEHVGPLFGIAAAATDLTIDRQASAMGGRTVVRFQQSRAGVPVLGGESIVEIGPTGDVMRASGEVLPDEASAATEPSTTPASAATGAMLVVSRDEGIPLAMLRARPATLAIHDPRLLGGPGIPLPRLVWRVDVSAEQPRVSEMVLIDAMTGAVAETIPLIHQGLDRRICDFRNERRKEFECNGPFARTEGQPPSKVAEVDRVYRHIGDFDAFYRDRFGRDGIDDQGMRYVATVRYCQLDWCPMLNAFWDWEKEQVAFGNGWAAADDLVGHEYQHGVLDHGSRLFYQYQSGAINEAFSDIFGEFVDLTNDRGNDDPGVRWLFGEDIIGYGVLRDLQDPPAYGDPDSVRSWRYWAGSGDDGGVHTNSGVVNKTASLLTDGGSFNGYTVDGLGIGKTAVIFYEAMLNGLTSAGDFNDLYDALPKACESLVGTNGIEASHCDEVRDAVQATELHLGPAGVTPVRAPICGDAMHAEDSFFDDLEDTDTGNWSAVAFGASKIRWFYPQDTHPHSEWDATYASSGTRNLYGEDHRRISDSAMVLQRAVTVPLGGYLRYEHAHSFDASGSTRHDGGVVELSVDGGSWFDAGTRFTHGGYNGTIATGAGNPLGGDRAFTADSYGYGSSRIELSEWAGSSIRVRFRIGTDDGVAGYGWYIDDIRIYGCLPD